MVERHPMHGTSNVDIVSFPRLAYRIFEEIAYFPAAVLEDMGKRLVLRQILEEQKEHLKVFGSSIHKQGFIENMKSMISELYQYQITPEKLEEKREISSLHLNYKLHDLAFIQRKFQGFLEEHFIVAEQLLEVLARKVEQSKKLKDAVIYIDGFTGFTPVQNQLLGKLLQCAKKIVVSVTADPLLEHRKWVQEYDLFAMSLRTIASLRQLAMEQAVEIEPSILLNEKISYRLRDVEDLSALEAGIFRFPVKTYEKEVENVTLFMARDPQEEVQKIAEKIEDYIRKQGYRYREIAVLVGDMETYAMHFERCFSELNIPYFIDHNKSILNNPCVESIRGILQMVEENFSYESVFRYLKAGMSELSMKEIDLLENYVIAKGIRGKSRWVKEFTMPMKGQTPAQLAKINEIREKFLEEVLDFYEACKRPNRTVREFMLALYEFLRKIQMEEKTKDLCQKFEEAKNFVMEKTYRQIYTHILELMDKMVDILGNDRKSISEITKILETGLEEMQIGVIPPGLDQIVVGDLTRTRFNEIKVLFFAGMNDGFIPKAVSEKSILNDYERECLQENGITLSETAIQSAYTEQFYLYLAVSKPTNHLYLSYATVSDGGESMRPSYFIQRIQKVLPKLKLTKFPRAACYTKSYGKHQFVHGLRQEVEATQEKQEEQGKNWKEIASLIFDSKEMEDYFDIACYQNKEEPLSKEAAKLVYGSILQNSVSRLEQFEACAYAHFLKYGLKVRPRQEFKIQAVDLGNIFHRSLELISKDIQTHHKDWNEVKEEEQRNLSEKAVEQAVKEWDAQLLNSTHRNQYVVDTIKRMTKRTLWALVKHLENSDFKPYAFEVEFSSYGNLQTANLELEEGVKMRLQGKIDRIDRFEDEKGIYLKVIDYKSGSKAFDLSDFYYGLQMQLVLYMNAVLEIEKKKAKEKPVIPAGMFYYSFKDPIVDFDPSQDAQDLILKELKMKGFVNSDYQIIEHMERDLPKTCISIPVSRTSKGYSAYSDVMNTKTFENIRRYADKKLKEAGNKIMSGDISISPYRKKNSTACDYCQYREICHFDGKLDSYHELEERSKKDLLKMWEEEDS